MRLMILDLQLQLYHRLGNGLALVTLPIPFRSAHFKA